MEQMFNVVSDVENYHKFLPWCESSVVKSRRKDHILADLVIGMKPVTESYTSSVSLHRPHLIRAESTKGRYFNNMITFWKFSPGLKGQSKTCIIDFYVSLEFRSSIHANIANVFFNEVVKAMAGAFYQEAKLRYGPESIPSRKIAIVSSKSDNDL
jgi:coenzyme Q-binding protein COQ10